MLNRKSKNLLNFFSNGKKILKLQESIKKHFFHDFEQNNQTKNFGFLEHGGIQNEMIFFWIFPTQIIC